MFLKKSEPKQSCAHCGKKITRSNLVRHEKNCDKNSARAKTRICPNCTKAFGSRIDNFNNHVARCAEKIGSGASQKVTKPVNVL